MKDKYSESWEIYKAHSEVFEDDFAYYLDFCKNHSALELFAGYGRLSNYLAKKGVDLFTVELSQNFSDLIEIPSTNKIVADVLEFSSEDRKWDRIFAGYNSFCLFTKEEDIKNFFMRLSENLSNDGLASLNYYHVDYWKDAVEYEFEFKGKKVHYTPKFDLSERSNGIGVWIDKYNFEGKIYTHEYTVRVYEDSTDLEKFLNFANLKLVNEIKEFGRKNVMEPGWIDFVVSKK